MEFQFFISCAKCCRTGVIAALFKFSYFPDGSGLLAPKATIDKLLEVFQASVKCEVVSMFDFFA